MAERTNIDVVLRLRDNATRALNAAMRTMQRRVKSLTKAIFNWRTALLGIAATAVSGKFVKGVIDVAAGFESTEVMLKRLYGTAAQARGALDFLVEFGARVPFGMKATQDAMVKLKVAGLDPMKGSLQDLTNAVAAFGGTDDDLRRASVAIFQMAGKGLSGTGPLTRLIRSL